MGDEVRAAYKFIPVRDNKKITAIIAKIRFVFFIQAPLKVFKRYYYDIIAEKWILINKARYITLYLYLFFIKGLERFKFILAMINFQMLNLKTLMI